MMSLEAGLRKVAKPSLERQDFGRDADDADTFIGDADVGIGKSGGKSGMKNPQQRGDLKSTLPPDPFGGRSALGGPSPFGNPFGGGRDDDESDDDEEEDLFADANNPFRSFRI